MPIVFKPNEFKIRSPEGTYYQASCIRGAPGVYYGTNEPQDSDMYVWINPNGDVTKTMEDPILTGIPTAPTAAVNTNTTQIATTAFVVAEIANRISSLDAMLFKGTLGTGGTITALPATHEAGWTYKVITAGTYAGKVCEVGDLIICIKDRATANDNDWTVAQTNIDGAVTGPVSSTSNTIAVYSDTTGKIIKTCGIVIEGEDSLSRGRKTNTSVGTGSFAFGNDVEASGDYSYAEGSDSVATGEWAHAEGACTIAGGSCAHSEGWHTTANHAAQHVSGKFNVSDPSINPSNEFGNYAEIIGNGTSNNARSNARALDWNGNEYLKGDLYIKCNIDSSDGIAVGYTLDTKTDKVTNSVSGNFAALDSNGNLIDSGRKHSDYLTSHQDITGKADKVASAVNGNFASLDSNGNLTDSGHKHSDYLTSHQDITGKADKVTSAISGNFASLDSNGNLTDSGYNNNSYIPLPSLPSTDGTYVLQVVILDGAPTYSWQAVNT